MNFLIIKKVLKIIFKRIFFWIIFVSVLLGFKIIWTTIIVKQEFSTDIKSREEVDKSRLHYILNEINKHDFGQEKFPKFIGPHFQGEWALGTLSMTSLAIANLAFKNGSNEKYINQIKMLIVKAMDKKFSHFDKVRWSREALLTLDRDDGHVAYLGHLNMMLGEYKLIGGDNQFDIIYKRINESLKRRFEKSPCGLLESYPSETYTMDNFVAIASIAIFDKLTGDKNQSWSKDWLIKVLNRYSDPELLMPVFGIDFDNCKVESPTTGVSGIWNSFFSSFVDQKIGLDLYKKSMQQWEISRLGFSGIGKFKNSYGFVGDIDSGPLLFGISLAATGFAIGPAMLAGEIKKASQFQKTIEFFGSTVNFGKGKFYLATPIVGDAILIAMRTAVPWTTNLIKK
ncbi:MAG: hypothetical protein ACXVCP_02265 [Bdellovibrio sp.]